MELENALTYLRMGYGIYRRAWIDMRGCRIFKHDDMLKLDCGKATEELTRRLGVVMGYQINSADVLADDWEFEKK